MMVKIDILGMLRSGEVFEKFSKILSLDISSKQVLLFCDFSEFNIPIGQEFNLMKDIKNDIVFKGKFILKGISQQFEKQFDEIPIGWQTICKFEIIEGDFTKFLNYVPASDDWDVKNTALSLISLP